MDAYNSNLDQNNNFFGVRLLLVKLAGIPRPGTFTSPRKLILTKHVLL